MDVEKHPGIRETAKLKMTNRGRSHVNAAQLIVVKAI